MFFVLLLGLSGEGIAATREGHVFHAAADGSERSFTGEVSLRTMFKPAP